MRRLVSQKQTIEILHCHTFSRRLRGFIGRRSIAENELLWLAPCAAVHTIGMRCSLALIFIDDQGRCLRMVEQTKLARIYTCSRARGVIEMRARPQANIDWVWQAIAPVIQDESCR